MKLFSKIKFFGLTLFLLGMPIKAHSIIKTAITVSDGSLQPGTTTGINISSGTIINFNVSAMTVLATETYTSTRINGTKTDNSTTTFTGGNTFTFITLSSGTSTVTLTDEGRFVGDNSSGGTGLTIRNNGTTDGGTTTTPYDYLKFYLSAGRNGGQIVAYRTSTYGSAALADSGLIFYVSIDDVNTEMFRIDASTSQIANNFKLSAGYGELWDRTLAQIRAITPGKTGQMYNCTTCTTTPVCISTGTGIAGFSALNSKTTVCQ